MRAVGGTDKQVGERLGESGKRRSAHCCKSLSGLNVVRVRGAAKDVLVEFRLRFGCAVKTESLHYGNNRLAVAVVTLNDKLVGKLDVLAAEKQRKQRVERSHEALDHAEEVLQAGSVTILVCVFNPLHVLRNVHIAPGHVNHLCDLDLCNRAVRGFHIVLCVFKAGFKPCLEFGVCKGAALNNGVEAVRSDVNIKLCKKVKYLGYCVGSGAVTCKQTAEQTGVDFIGENGIAAGVQNGIAVFIKFFLFLVVADKQRHEPVNKFVGNNNLHCDVFHRVKLTLVIFFNSLGESLFKRRNEEIHYHRNERGNNLIGVCNRKVSLFGKVCVVALVRRAESFGEVIAPGEL